MNREITVKAIIRKSNGSVITKLVDGSDYNRDIFEKYNSLGKMHLELTASFRGTSFTMAIEKDSGRKIINFGYSHSDCSGIDEFTVYYEDHECTTFSMKKEISYI